MSQLTQHTLSVRPGATALQVASIFIQKKCGPINLRFTVLPALNNQGYPRATDPAVISFEESSDNGANWTTLGSAQTVKADLNYSILPSKRLIRILAKTSNGLGGYVKMDIQHTGRYAQGGQLDVKVVGGKEGYTYNGSGAGASAGEVSATPAGSWPGTVPPTP